MKKPSSNAMVNLANRAVALRAEPWVLVGWLCLISGLFARLAPFISGGNSILQHWPTEDGYLMLTIARNIALGLGMSVSDGTVATNGTQPLATFLYSFGFLFSSGNKPGGVIFSLLLQTCLSVLAAWLMYRLARKFLPDTEHNRIAAALGAGIWFAGPITLPHTMNCLESGVYITCILISLLYWYHWVRSPGTCVDWGKSTKLGLLLGLTMWARIDAIFIIAALCCAHLYPGLVPASRNRLPKLLLEAGVAGLVCVTIISPWLIYAKIDFGYWMPISGISERIGAIWGSNLQLVPVKFFEYIAGIISIPSSLEYATLIQLACGAAVTAWIVIVVRGIRRAERHQRQLGMFLATLGALLTLFYGALFGAEHFLSRYFFPVSVLVSPLTAYIMVSFVRTKLPRLFRTPVAVIVLAMVLAQQVRLLFNGSRHPHRQVVGWVERNVPDSVWVGAAQSGTLGFFHDRTLNFDGKVDPRSLHAILENRAFEYIEQSAAQALIDWNTFTTWNNAPTIRRSFEMVVDDPEDNLTVFVRRQGPLSHLVPSP